MWQMDVFKIQLFLLFYRCTVHFEIYAVHSPTNALFINLVKSFKFTLKYTIILLLNFRSLMTIVRKLYLYLTKVIFMLKHSVKLRRYINQVMWQHVVQRHMCCVLCRVRLQSGMCVVCSVQSENVERRVCCVQCRVRLQSGMCVVCSAV